MEAALTQILSLIRTAPTSILVEFLRGATRSYSEEWRRWGAATKSNVSTAGKSIVLDLQRWTIECPSCGLSASSIGTSWVPELHMHNVPSLGCQFLDGLLPGLPACSDGSWPLIAARHPLTGTRQQATGEGYVCVRIVEWTIYDFEVPKSTSR